MKYILVFILIIFSLSYIFRLLFPWMLRRLARRVQSQYGYTNPSQEHRKEGNVKVDGSTKHPNSKKKVSKNVGDYVDFEEVK